MDTKGRMLAVLVGVTALTGCANLGVCEVECIREAGGTNGHGPWENYTSGECSDAAEVETTIFQTCIAHWDSY